MYVPQNHKIFLGSVCFEGKKVREKKIAEIDEYEFELTFSLSFIDFCNFLSSHFPSFQPNRPSHKRVIAASYVTHLTLIIFFSVDLARASELSHQLHC
jgi:hypothetical protein